MAASSQSTSLTLSNETNIFDVLQYESLIKSGHQQPFLYNEAQLPKDLERALYTVAIDGEEPKRVTAIEDLTEWFGQLIAEEKATTAQMNSALNLFHQGGMQTTFMLASMDYLGVILNGLTVDTGNDERNYEINFAFNHGQLSVTAICYYEFDPQKQASMPESDTDDVVHFSITQSFILDEENTFQRGENTFAYCRLAQAPSLMGDDDAAALFEMFCQLAKEKNTDSRVKEKIRVTDVLDRLSPLIPECMRSSVTEAATTSDNTKDFIVLLGEIIRENLKAGKIEENFHGQFFSACIRALRKSRKSFHRERNHSEALTQSVEQGIEQTMENKRWSEIIATLIKTQTAAAEIVDNQATFEEAIDKQLSDTSEYSVAQVTEKLLSVLCEHAHTPATKEVLTGIINHIQEVTVACDDHRLPQVLNTAVQQINSPQRQPARHSFWDRSREQLNAFLKKRNSDPRGPSNNDSQKAASSSERSQQPSVERKRSQSH